MQILLQMPFLGDYSKKVDCCEGVADYNLGRRHEHDLLG